MSNAKTNKKIEEQFYEFDALENITASADWNLKLTKKLLLNHSLKIDSARNYMFLVIGLVIINISFMTYSFVGTLEKKERVAFNLKLVSNEILIPSTN